MKLSLLLATLYIYHMQGKETILHPHSACNPIWILSFFSFVKNIVQMSKAIFQFSVNWKNIYLNLIWSIKYSVSFFVDNSAFKKWYVC